MFVLPQASIIAFLRTLKNQVQFCGTLTLGTNSGEETGKPAKLPRKKMLKDELSEGGKPTKSYLRLEKLPFCPQRSLVSASRLLVTSAVTVVLRISVLSGSAHAMKVVCSHLLSNRPSALKTHTPASTGKVAHLNYCFSDFAPLQRKPREH